MKSSSHGARAGSRTEPPANRSHWAIRRLRLSVSGAYLVTLSELSLADEKHAPFFKANGMLERGQLLGLTGRACDAVQTITTGITALRVTGATRRCQGCLSNLARAPTRNSAEFDDAWRCLGEAMAIVKTAKERWWEAEINRVAGEITLKSPEPDAAKAQEYFERALTVARQQQAKS